MPPSPRNRPALERALPGDFTGARADRVTFPDPVIIPEPWSVQFGGHAHEWHQVAVRYRWYLPDGREIVNIEWSVSGMRQTETFFADPARMRKLWTDD